MLGARREDGVKVLGRSCTDVPYFILSESVTGINRNMDAVTLPMTPRGPYYEYDGRGYAVLPGVDIRVVMPVSVFTANKELR